MSQRWERWWAAAPPLLRFDLRRSTRLARGRRGRWQLALALLVFGAAYAGGLRSLSASLGGREGGDLLALLIWLVATWCVVGLAALNASLLTADREQGRFDELAVIPQSDAAWLWGRLATPALSSVAIVVLSAGPIVLGACLRPNDGPPLGAGLAIVFGSAAAGLALGLLATMHARSAATARVVAPLLALGWLCVPYVLATYAWSAGGGGYPLPGLLDPSVLDLAATWSLAALLVVLPAALLYARFNFARLWRYRAAPRHRARRQAARRPLGDNPVYDRERRSLLQRPFWRWLDRTYAVLTPLVVLELATGSRWLNASALPSAIGPQVLLLCAWGLLLHAEPAASLAAEWQRGTWDSLLASPLSSARIIWGKVGAAVAPLRWPLILLVVCLLADPVANAGTWSVHAWLASASAFVILVGAGTLGWCLRGGLGGGAPVGLLHASRLLIAGYLLYQYGVVRIDALTPFEDNCLAPLALLVLTVATVATVDGAVTRLTLLRTGRPSWRPRAWLLAVVALLAGPVPPTMEGALQLSLLLALALVAADPAGPADRQRRAWWQVWWHVPETAFTFTLLGAAWLLSRALAGEEFHYLETWRVDLLPAGLLAFALFAGAMEWLRRRWPARNAQAAGAAALALAALLLADSSVYEREPYVLTFGLALSMLPLVSYALFAGRQQERATSCERPRETLRS